MTPDDAREEASDARLAEAVAQAVLGLSGEIAPYDRIRLNLAKASIKGVINVIRADERRKSASKIESLQNQLNDLRRAWPSEPVYVNASPDPEYPIRILEAHRESEKSCWSEGFSLDGSAEILAKIVNEASQDRVRILDIAIAKLKSF